MKKILFPTDFSETANNAFIYALHLAKGLDAEIFVLHTFERPVISSLHGGRPELIEDVYTNIELNEFDRFKEQVPLMREIAEEYHLEDVSMKFLFEKGILTQVIKHLVRKENIDLIVMGTSGQTGFSKKFWGTNTINTIQSMNVPVLSIPHFAAFHKIKTIGMTTVFKDTDKPLISHILRSADYFDGVVKVFHVIEYNGNVERKEHEAEEKIAEWKEYFDNPRLEFIVEKHENLKLAVANLAQREHVDMLIVVKRNLTFVDSFFYPSLSKTLAAKINIPLMIVREALIAREYTD